jgi:hypothetical protein
MPPRAQGWPVSERSRVWRADPRPGTSGRAGTRRLWPPSPAGHHIPAMGRSPRNKFANTLAGGTHRVSRSEAGTPAVIRC